MAMEHGHVRHIDHVSTREAQLARDTMRGGSPFPAGRDGAVVVAGAGTRTPFAEVEGADTIDGLTGLTAGHVPNTPLR